MDGISQFVLLAKRILRELKALNESVRAGFSGVQKQIEAVAKNGEAHENSTDMQDAKPCDVLVSKLTLPKTVEEYYQSHKDERPSERPRGKWGWIKFCMEAGGLIALVVYVVFTARTLKETRKQAAAAQGQLDVMRSGQRPWLGILGKVNLTSKPIFQIPPISPPNKRGISLAIEGNFVVHNFGTSPAFDESVLVDADIPAGDTITRPTTFMMCPDEDVKLHHGEVIFPSSGVISGFNTQTGRYGPPRDITEVRRIWLLGCISYHDAEGKVIHHTRFWLRSNFPDNTAWIQLTPDFRYMPIVSFESWGEEAD
jgi:hypothetical protein